jgi:hypothetical protein
MVFFAVTNYLSRGFYIVLRDVSAHRKCRVVSAWPPLSSAQLSSAQLSSAQLRPNSTCRRYQKHNVVQHMQPGTLYTNPFLATVSQCWTQRTQRTQRGKRSTNATRNQASLGAQHHSRTDRLCSQKNFPTSYATRRFITAFTTAVHWFLP